VKRRRKREEKKKEKAYEAEGKKRTQKQTERERKRRGATILKSFSGTDGDAKNAFVRTNSDVRVLTRGNKGGWGEPSCPIPFNQV
jgi:hypothetical protein